MNLVQWIGILCFFAFTETESHFFKSSILNYKFFILKSKENCTFPIKIIWQRGRHFQFFEQVRVCKFCQFLVKTLQFFNWISNKRDLLMNEKKINFYLSVQNFMRSLNLVQIRMRFKERDSLSSEREQACFKLLEYSFKPSPLFFCWFLTCISRPVFSLFNVVTFKNEPCTTATAV